LIAEYKISNQKTEDNKKQKKKIQFQQLQENQKRYLRRGTL
tara:strand:- start:230 stop:352 length:123 start_codon:yes stop_codon:yes gene_type:complete